MHLLLVEELPDAEHLLKVVASNLVEVSLLSRELFLILLFQHLEIKTQETLNFWSVVGLEPAKVIEEVVESPQQPVVELRPS